MANFHGKEGFVHWSDSETEIPEVLSWSLDATADVSDQTAMQDEWKTYLAGFKDWTATVETNAPAAGPTLSYSAELGKDVSGDVAKLVMYTVYATNDYKYIYGDAVCTGVSYSVDAQDVGKLTYTFQGSGALAVGSGASPKTFA